jgi:UDP-N-acetyl-2-amino-2-deoxyglucuronate dehydrogenase
LLTQAIHTLDLPLHLVGPHRSVAFAMTSLLREIDAENVVAAARQLESGAIGVLDATTVARPGYPNRIEIAGTEGSAMMEGSALTPRGRGGTVAAGTALAGGGGANPMAFDHGPHRSLAEEMAAAIAQQRRSTNDARSAVLVQRLIEDLLADTERRA